MRLIEYILKFGFGLALGLVIVFIVSPLLFNKAKELGTEILKKDELQSLSVEYLVTNNNDYVKIKGVLSNNRDFKVIYDTSENNSYKELIDILFEGNIITSNDIQQVIPLKISKSKLNKLDNVQVVISDQDHLEKLLVGNIYIIGNKPSSIRSAFVYMLGVVVFMFGLASFFVTIIMLYNLRHQRHLKEQLCGLILVLTLYHL